MKTTTSRHNTAAVAGLELWKTLLKPNTASIHLTLWATLFGSHLFHGFIGGPTAFMAVPRQTFGLLQSKIFPLYFGMGTLIPTALIANLAYAQGSISKLPTLPLASLVIPFVANAINWLYLGPKTTKLMFERHAQEKQESVDAYKEKHKVRHAPSPPGSHHFYHPLSAAADHLLIPSPTQASPKMQAMSKRFARLHGISNLLNLASFASLIIHGSVSGSTLDVRMSTLSAARG